MLERADRVGGMAASLEVAGVRVDHGSHRLHPRTDPAVLADLRALLGDDLQTRPRNGRIRLDGRWVALPAARRRPACAARPAAFAAGAARDARHRAAAAARGPTRSPRSCGPGSGPTVADALLRPYARKLWGVDPTELAGELARRRVGAPSAGRLVRRLRARPRGRAAGPSSTRAGASAQIAEALADAAVDAGADDPPRRDGRRLDARGADGVDGTLADGATLDADRVLVDRAAARARGLVDPAPPPAVPSRRGASRHRAWCSSTSCSTGRRWTAVRRPLLPRTRRSRGPPVGAAQLPRQRRRPRRPHRAVRRDAVRRSATTTWAGERPTTSARVVADALARAGPARRARRSTSRSRGCRASTPSTGPASSGTSSALDLVGRRPARRCSPSAARACSSPTTPTTPWRWAGRPPRVPAAGRHARQARWARPGPASASTSSRTERREPAAPGAPHRRARPGAGTGRAARTTGRSCGTGSEIGTSA